MLGEISSTRGHGKFFFLSGVGMVILFGWIFFPLFLYRPIEQPVQFSHAAHTGDNVGLKCEDCHVFDGDGKFQGIPTIDRCVSCHSQPIGVSEEEERFARVYVIPRRNVPWVIYSKQPQNVFFSHSIHVKLGGVDCQQCHFGQAYTTSLRPAYVSRISGYSLDVFGRNLFNIPPTPSSGMRMNDCSKCHQKYGINESCIGCHK
jgi:hypothetical protein